MIDKELKKRILSSIFLIPFTFFFIIKGNILFNFFICICFLITFYEWNKMSKKILYKLYGFIFLIFSFYTLYYLRHKFGFEIILFVLFICVLTDIGGYIFGKVFKGPKLTKISPKKTYAGVFGSYFMSTIVTIFFLKSPFIVNLPNFSYQVFILILLISTVSQLGDIIISYFKRLSKIKDTGKIIPGHGGILDRVDGMIFAFPFAYLLIYFDLF